MDLGHRIPDLVRPLWQAVHAQRPTPLLPEQRSALGARLYSGAPRLVQAVAQAARDCGHEAEAERLLSQQEQAHRWALLRDQFTALARLCSDSHIAAQAGAVTAAEALTARLCGEVQAAPEPALIDALLLLGRRAALRRKGHPAPPAPRSTARRSERIALRLALRALWEHLQS